MSAETVADSIPAGYKQTEVGVIPENWKVIAITEATDNIFLGLTTKVDYVESGGIPLIRASDIAEGKLRFSEARTISVCQHRELTKYRRAKKGNVLVSKSGSLGVCALVDVDTEFSIYESIIVLQPNHQLNSMFLLWLLRDENTQKRMKGEKVGSSVGHLNLEMFRQLFIPLPNIPEQTAIATILSDTDAFIESLEQLIAKKRQIKQGAMQELLTGKRRLPGFSGEWENKKLGDLGSFLKGSGIAKDESLTGNIPCVRYGEIYTKHNDYIKEFYSWISQGVASTAARLNCGDILFAGSGETKEEIGKCVAFVDKMESYAGGDIVILRPKNVDSLFLGYYLNTTPINRQKASRGQGDAIVHIGSAALADINITIPSLLEQVAIATILSDMDAEITSLEEKLVKTRQLKQGMMQELLTGRIRLV